MRSKLLKRIRKYSVVELDFNYHEESPKLKGHRIDYSVLNKKGEEVFRIKTYDNRYESIDNYYNVVWRVFRMEFLILSIVAYELRYYGGLWQPEHFSLEEIRNRVHREFHNRKHIDRKDKKRSKKVISSKKIWYNQN